MPLIDRLFILVEKAVKKAGEKRNLMMGLLSWSDGDFEKHFERKSFVHTLNPQAPPVRRMHFLKTKPKLFTQN